MKQNLRDWVISSTTTNELAERLDIFTAVMDQELKHYKDKAELLEKSVNQYSEVLSRVLEPQAEYHPQP